MSTSLPAPHPSSLVSRYSGLWFILHLPLHAILDDDDKAQQQPGIWQQPWQQLLTPDPLKAMLRRLATAQAQILSKFSERRAQTDYESAPQQLRTLSGRPVRWPLGR